MALVTRVDATDDTTEILQSAKKHSNFTSLSSIIQVFLQTVYCGNKSINNVWQ